MMSPGGGNGARTTPVLVLGGGPSGLATAIELGTRGVEVVVVETRRSVSHARPRAKTTSARTMELFRRWGIADEIRTASALPVRWSNRVTFCLSVTGPEITHFDGVFGLDLIDSDLVAEAGQQVTQPVVEEVLRRHAARLPSVDLLLGWRGTAIEKAADGFRVRIEAADGTQQQITSQWLIGADGPRSQVRRYLGASYVGADAGRPNVNITFRSERLAALIPHPGSIHYWVLNPASPGVVGPLDLHGTWWAISTGTAAVSDDEEAAGIVANLVDADIDIQVLATDPWQARMLLADSYGSEGAFLVGDAAHQNPPWGGHGFNTGIGDAVNLGWKLAAVVQGWAPRALLTSYETERRPVAQRTMDVAAANMGTLSTDLADPDLAGRGDDADAARARAAATVQRTKSAEFHSLDLVLGYGYTPAADRQVPSPGEYRPLLEAGNRLPHRWLADGRSLYDDLGPGFTVIGTAADVDGLIRAAGSRGVPLALLAPAPDLGQPVVLVRPDQHIAWVGPRPDDPMDVLDAALRGFPAVAFRGDQRPAQQAAPSPTRLDSQRRLENRQ